MPGKVHSVMENSNNQNEITPDNINYKMTTVMVDTNGWVKLGTLSAN